MSITRQHNLFDSIFIIMKKVSNYIDVLRTLTPWGKNFTSMCIKKTKGSTRVDFLIHKHCK